MSATAAVVFKREQGRVLAVFPYEPGTYDPWTCSCYAHLGQHSAAAWNYVLGLPNAGPDEYGPLLAELERIGYRLRVLSRLPGREVARMHRRQRLT